MPSTLCIIGTPVCHSCLVVPARHAALGCFCQPVTTHAVTPARQLPASPARLDPAAHDPLNPPLDPEPRARSQAAPPPPPAHQQQELAAAAQDLPAQAPAATPFGSFEFPVAAQAPRAGLGPVTVRRSERTSVDGSVPVTPDSLAGGRVALWGPSRLKSRGLRLGRCCGYSVTTPGLRCRLWGVVGGSQLCACHPRQPGRHGAGCW